MILFAGALVASAGCSSAAPAPSDERAAVRAQGLFWAPEGIAVHERWILVTNTAFYFDGPLASWGQGFTTVIDRKTRRVVSRVASSQPNPRDVLVSGDRAYVVNGGTTKTDHDLGLVTVTSSGGLDIIDLSADIAPTAVAANIPLPQNPADPRIGSYGSLVLSPDGRFALIGSGTRGDIFKLDLEQKRVVYGADNPLELFPTDEKQNGLTLVRRFGDTLAVLNFNSDELCVSRDWQGDFAQRSCGSVGVNQELLEGPIDLARDRGRDLPRADDYR